jgi:hypothetical protein
MKILKIFTTKMTNTSLTSKGGVGFLHILEALNMFETDDVKRRLDRITGSAGLVSLCREPEQKTEYHPDGVYEAARFGKDGETYVAYIFDGNGGTKRVPYSVKGLAGILVPSSQDNNLIFPFQGYPRMVKLKLTGNPRDNIRNVLESQAQNAQNRDFENGQVVLIKLNTLGEERTCAGKYEFARVNSCDDKSFGIQRFNSDGSLNNIDLVGYNMVDGILVQEQYSPRQLPPR